MSSIYYFILNSNALVAGKKISRNKKGVKKRFKLTKKGRIKRAKAGGRHILSKKTRKRKRSLRKSGIVDSTMEKKIRKLMPYG